MRPWFRKRCGKIKSSQNGFSINMDIIQLSNGEFRYVIGEMTTNDQSVKAEIQLTRKDMLKLKSCIDKELSNPDYDVDSTRQMEEYLAREKQQRSANYSFLKDYVQQRDDGFVTDRFKKGEKDK